MNDPTIDEYLRGGRISDDVVGAAAETPSAHGLSFFGTENAPWPAGTEHVDLGAEDRFGGNHAGAELLGQRLRTRAVHVRELQLDAGRRQRARDRPANRAAPLHCHLEASKGTPAPGRDGTKAPDEPCGHGACEGLFIRSNPAGAPGHGGEIRGARPQVPGGEIEPAELFDATSEHLEGSLTAEPRVFEDDGLGAAGIDPRQSALEGHGAGERAGVAVGLGLAGVAPRADPSGGRPEGEVVDAEHRAQPRGRVVPEQQARRRSLGIEESHPVSFRHRAPLRQAVSLAPFGGMNRSRTTLALLAAFGLGCAQPPERGGAAMPEGHVAVRRPGDASIVDAVADAGTQDTGVDAPSQPSVAILRPMAGARLAREEVSGTSWVARVEVEVEGHGVAALELSLDGAVVDRAEGSSATFSLELRGDGPRRIGARGLDASGLERARDEITVQVAPPDDGSCHAMLDALGLTWEPAGANRGIADPVLVEPVLADVAYRYVSRSEPTTLLMDCELAPRLVQLSELVSDYGIDEVIHIGIYNYRCIGGGDPDSGSCTPSQHAFARAIDLWGFGLAASDAEYVVERDWVVTEETCPGSPRDPADQVLHEIACAMYADGIFQIVLTPNYNAAHRNHFHVDMTEGSMFIGSGVAGVDPDVGGLGHDWILPNWWRRVPRHPLDLGPLLPHLP